MRLPDVRNNVHVGAAQKFGRFNNTDPEQNLEPSDISAGLNMLTDRTGSIYNRLGSIRKNNFLGQTTGILNMFNFTNKAGTQHFLSIYDTSVWDDSGSAWTALTGGALTTNLQSEGAYYPDQDSFYIVNKTDTALVYASGGTLTTDAALKKGSCIEFFDGRLVVGNTTGNENRLWVTDIGVTTTGSSSWQDCDASIVGIKAVNQRLLLVWTEKGLYKVPAFTSTPSAAGLAAFYDVDKIGAIARRSIVRIGGACYWVGLDSQNNAEVYLTDGQRVIPIGGQAIKNYLQGFNPTYLPNICATKDGRYYRFSVTPTGATTNTREYLYDTVDKHWLPEQRPGFPINCYSTIRVSGADVVYAGNQSVGQVMKLNTGHYDEMIDQSFTTTQDTNLALDANAAKRVAQSFQLSCPVTKTRYVTGGAVLIKKNTGTTTGLDVRIETSSAGVPTGTLADSNATTTLAAVTSTSYAWQTFTYSTPFALPGTTTYQLVLKHTTEGSGTSQYYVGALAAGGYTGGTDSTYASSTWSAGTADILFVLFIEEEIESYATQMSSFGVNYPKKMQRYLVDGSSSTGVTGKVGIGTEGRDSNFQEVDLAFTGKTTNWANNSSDTSNLIWAADANSTAANTLWAANNTNYEVTAYLSPYVPKSQNISTRFYYKGIGDFRVNSYIPVYEVVRATR